MNTMKSNRNGKNIYSQPAFKVKISKRKKLAASKFKKKCTNSSAEVLRSKNRREPQSDGITNFLAKKSDIKIPSPPKSLLEEIKEEKIKLAGYGIDIGATHWSFPFLWDNDEFLISLTNDLLNNLYKKPVSRAVSTRPLNSFMAFRVYNAQFGYGLRQNILSSLLASAWHSHPEQQNIWDTFAQQFNFVKPKCGFVEWVDQRYERES
ncbi:hypothetical protein HG535_0A01352 [Zygotorulaspora mrakii]|uniref:Alpha box domain-containing protein n=1 Tax=Zygotorulaspora mrakii TaxID=42260 RepID=A0A7H9AVL4_ZYGMR|nr:uncharacterized protein HG535_0A00190 [Zygotorulaspora mrakii]XP_037141925.1 uncharacterized protein HG535_0A01352 [Zygotorulaspora mrakii]QLG70080.1 hypothetical protein HG535_0A00190 [Zygotorulaspora mrakii]QLG70197.1 hypothetical protein HG535_0A01352 [Zygotorulaspora mrakii]